MKTLKNIFLASFLIIFSATILKAQIGTVAGGGVATGTTGNVSFSVGQINCITNTGTGGTITQGLQQPFEIFTVTGIEEQNINLIYSAFPNPASDFIFLNISNPQKLNFSLMDIQGKILMNEKINDVQTKINLAETSPGTYFINVSDNKNILKTFKIIKY